MRGPRDGTVAGLLPGFVIATAIKSRGLRRPRFRVRRCCSAPVSETIALPVVELRAKVLTERKLYASELICDDSVVIFTAQTRQEGEVSPRTGDSYFHKCRLLRETEFSVYITSLIDRRLLNTFCVLRHANARVWIREQERA